MNEAETRAEPIDPALKAAGESDRLARVAGNAPVPSAAMRQKHEAHSAAAGKGLGEAPAPFATEAGARDDASQLHRSCNAKRPP